MEKAVEYPRERAAIWRFAAWLLRVARVVVFFVLFWLRWPVVFVCDLLYLPLFLVFLFSLYAFPDKPFMTWGIALLSFLAFAVRLAYDTILAYVTPN